MIPAFYMYHWCPHLLEISPPRNSKGGHLLSSRHLWTPAYKVDFNYLSGLLSGWTAEQNHARVWQSSTSAIKTIFLPSLVFPRSFTTLLSVKKRTKTHFQLCLFLNQNSFPNCFSSPLVTVFLSAQALPLILSHLTVALALPANVSSPAKPCSHPINQPLQKKDQRFIQ